MDSISFSINGIQSKLTEFKQDFERITDQDQKISSFSPDRTSTVETFSRIIIHPGHLQ